MNTCGFCHTQVPDGATVCTGCRARYGYGSGSYIGDALGVFVAGPILGGVLGFALAAPIYFLNFSTAHGHLGMFAGTGILAGAVLMPFYFYSVVGLMKQRWRRKE